MTKPRAFPKTLLQAVRYHADLDVARGVTRKTAWFMLQRIRLAMQTEGFQAPLLGTIEAAETFIGGSIKNNPSRKRGGKTGQWEKTAVVGVLKHGGADPSTVRALVIPEAKPAHMIPGVRDNAAEGSDLMTDGQTAYRLLEVDYDHRWVGHLKEDVRGEVHTNGIENFWCLLKRSIRGTYTQPDPKHLSRYLDEQVWRFNTRTVRHGERFARALAMVAGCR